MAVGTSAALGQFVLVALAFAALAWAHLTSDFSVLNVARIRTAPRRRSTSSRACGQSRRVDAAVDADPGGVRAIVAVFGRSLPARCAPTRSPCRG